MSKTAIEWTDRTWNPTVGCSQVSDGCRECYAIQQAGRIIRMGGKGAETYAGTLTDDGSDWSGQVNLSPA